MAHVLATRTLTDTATRVVVMCEGRAGDATDLAANVVFDSSASKYALATITLAAAPTTNFCIGEIITSDSINMVVQNYTKAATTVSVYRCTSGTDSTPLGWSAATVPGTSEAIVGAVSGTSSTTTHGSTVVTHVGKVTDIRAIRWNVSGGHSVLLYFAGSSATQNIGYFVGGGTWGKGHGEFVAVTQGSAAGDTGSVLGNVLATSYGSAAHDTETLQIEVGKITGWNTPNYEGNGQLGYSTQRIQHGNY